jgi:hypothetical protein
MAATKTNPWHLVMQLGAGIVLGGVAYQSLMKIEKADRPALHEAEPSSDRPQGCTSALELEKQKTSSYYWNGEGKQERGG